MHGHLSFELTCPPSPKPSFAPSLLLTPLESALIQVFILGNLKLFRMNTYKKHRGEGVLLLTTHPMRMRILSERSESKDLSSHPTRESVLSDHRKRGIPLQARLINRLYHRVNQVWIIEFGQLP